MNQVLNKNLVPGKKQPKFIRMQCKRGKAYYYFQARGISIRMPPPWHVDFPAAYRAAMKQLPEKRRKSPELFKGTGMRPGDLHPYFANIMRGAAVRAAKNGMDFSLPKDWAANQYIAQKGRCALSSIPMRKPQQPWDAYGPSIDRICSNTGYTPENCQLVLYAVNSAKSNFPQDDFIAICKAIGGYKKRQEAQKRYHEKPRNPA